MYVKIVTNVCLALFLAGCAAAVEPRDDDAGADVIPDVIRDAGADAPRVIACFDSRDCPPDLACDIRAQRCCAGECP